MRRIIFYCLMALCANQAIAQYSGKGSGTTEDPYLLTTALNVEEIRNFQGVEGIVFRLENDIDMSELIEDTYGYAGWNPLPNFRGELDGNGFTISGLFIYRSVEKVGFFSDMSGANIHDLTLIYSGDITGSKYVGGLCGYAAESCNIERCLIRGNKISGSYIVGGLLGNAINTVVNECIVESINIIGHNVGGLIGCSKNSSISNNKVKTHLESKKIDNNSSNNLGGIVGVAYDGLIKNNISEGILYISSKEYSNPCVGGIVGITGCRVFSNVEICDSILLRSSFNISFNYGRISGADVSGLSDPTATNANRAYNKTVIKIGSDNGSYATDSKQNGLSVGDILLKSVNMYKSMGWDMENVWTIDDGNSYPRLKWEVEKDLENPPLTITSQDKPINEKEVLSFLAEKVTASIGGGVTYTYYQCVPDEPLITNSSSHPQQVTVTVTSEDFSHLKWAGIDGQEGDMTESTESRSCQLERGTSIPLKLHAVFADQDFVSYTATIRVSCEQYARTFTIVFTNENPDKPVCPTPTIDYADGKLIFNCEAEGTPEYHVTISNPDVNTHTVDGELQLERTYNIEVYATATGYQASENEKLILCWIDTKIVDGVYDLKKEEGVPVQIRVNNGIVSISGVAKDTLVAAYTLEGILLDSATSSSESVTLNIPASTNVFILKIGNKSVKITL